MHARYQTTNFKKFKRLEKKLPILYYKQQLYSTLKNINVLIVYGSTGSGKSTQISQLLLNSTIRLGKIIVCTQPRRMAVVSLASRVSCEIDSQIGKLVGYSIRFEDCYSKYTKIKYLTDGILIRECLIDQMLTKYSIIIIDEAHERSINTDIVMGTCKKLLTLRSDLRILITSATLNLKLFTDYFFHCPILMIPGKIYDIKLCYTRKKCLDYFEATLKTIILITKNNVENSGDILSFLTGKREIDSMCSMLEKIYLLNPQFHIYPLHGSLSIIQQGAIFKKNNLVSRNCIVSTNVAETSLTIPKIKYVIDSGFYKCKYYDPLNYLESLIITPISKSSAEQRAGRAGRVTSGTCFRLYTKEIFKKEMPKSGIPEIKRSNLTTLVLMIKSFGLNHIYSFDFIEEPLKNMVLLALEELFLIEAIDTNGTLTRLGKLINLFPINPKMSKSLILSVILGCSVATSIILGMLTNQIFFQELKSSKKTGNLCLNIYSSLGDLITYLNVYKYWVKNKYATISNSSTPLNYFALIQSRKISKQLIKSLFVIDVTKVNIKCNNRNICKAFTGGFINNLAKKSKKNIFLTIRTKKLIDLHPTSSLNYYGCDWIIYTEIINSFKKFLKNVCKTNIKWIRLISV